MSPSFLAWGLTALMTCWRKSTKGGLYARAGLPEYWIANLVEGVLEVHREPRSAPETAYGCVYRSVEILRPPASVTPLGAPGSLIPVADLLP